MFKPDYYYLHMLKAISFFLLIAQPVVAGTLKVNVTDNKSAAVQYAVITLTTSVPAELPTKKNSKPAAVKQINEQFEPYVSVVSVGSKVSFPNRDTIKHHVYSFSEAKTFELELYDEFSGKPVLFDKTGIVELGCNIHDWMLAYIYVTDAPYFSITADTGATTLQLPDGEYKLSLWHPNMDPRESNKPISVSVSGDTQVDISLTHPLSQQLDLSSGFSDY